MIRSEMKARLDMGEDPLEISILKWKDIIYNGGKDNGMMNCALCNAYYDVQSDGCDTCLVMLKTGEAGCDGILYEEWDLHHGGKYGAKEDRIIHCETCKEMAMREIEFLESLRGE